MNQAKEATGTGASHGPQQPQTEGGKCCGLEGWPKTTSGMLELPTVGAYDWVRDNSVIIWSKFQSFLGDHLEPEVKSCLGMRRHNVSESPET